MDSQTDVNGIPVEWHADGEGLRFAGVEGIILWKDPSLRGLLAPLRDALGEALYARLMARDVAASSRADSDLIAAAPDLASGFRVFADTVAAAGWGRFRLETHDAGAATARVTLEYPWELELFPDATPEHALPFAEGKLTGIFSHLFATPCRATPEQVTTSGAPRAVFSVAPAQRDLDKELRDLEKTDGLTVEEQLRAANQYLRLHQEELESRVEARTRALEQADRYNRLLLDAIPEGIFGVDREGRFTFLNPAAQRLLGHDPEAIRGHAAWTLLQPGRADTDNGPGAPECPAHCVLGRGEACHVDDDTFRTADGADIPVSYYCAPLYQEGEVTGAVVTFRDIRDQKAAEAEQRHLLEVLSARAYHDDLTGLPNRRHLVERLDGALESPGGDELALVLLDLDRFQEVNDSLGHAAGDWLLQQAAGRLHALLPTGGELAHLGGDLFGILLHPAPEAGTVANLVEGMLATLHEPFTLDGEPVRVSASAGIARGPGDGLGGESLLRSADTALHRAKDAGRGTWRAYTSELTTAARNHLKVATELREAVAQGDLVVYYQPLVDASTGDIIAAEALARWHHSDYGWVPPDQFIPVAEETDLILGLGEWVLTTAVAQVASWRRQGLRLPRLSVNLSPRQLHQRDLADTVGGILAHSGLEPSVLELEITENAFLEEQIRTGGLLDQLHGRGVTLAIDDFGTGYASLAYLKHLPVDRIKLDRSFVQGLPTDNADLAISRSVAALGQSLDVGIVAEGVEGPEQAGCLADLGIAELQGFYFGRPLPAGTFTDFLQSGPRRRPESC
ncbi:EAL domain-containing protein [Thiohalospira halophila]|uniref:EAL domain-containing protein n=1 Tax=Thiohalospira halophila TaxID=381300 RepID=UPI000B87FCB7|nr:EAL domain-containing protein [Thiohalospira halophila]